MHFFGFRMSSVLKRSNIIAIRWKLLGERGSKKHAPGCTGNTPPAAGKTMHAKLWFREQILYQVHFNHNGVPGFPIQTRGLSGKLQVL